MLHFQWLDRNLNAVEDVSFFFFIYIYMFASLIFLVVGAWYFFLDALIDRIRLFFLKRLFLRRYTQFFLIFRKLEDICL